MALKTEHFTTPIKLILPGIIVSLIGLTASNVIFNDPVKIRGRNSKAAWNNLQRYEKIYEENSEELTCTYATSNSNLFYKDLVHLQEMTVENLKMIRDDKDIDKLMAAIINLRIDTYTQLKKITTDFIDSLNILVGKTVEIINTVPYDSVAHSNSLNEQGTLQKEFLADRDHVVLRDTIIIKNLGDELKRTYSSFENTKFMQGRISIDTIKQRIFGTWSLVSEEIPTRLKLEKDNTGTITLDGADHPITWKFGEDDQQTIMTIHATNNAIKDWKLQVVHCTKKILQYHSDKNPTLRLVGCRESSYP